jgi:hypothetical protein
MDFSFSGSRNQCKTKTITKQMMVGCPLFKKKEWRNVLEKCIVENASSVLLC